MVVKARGDVCASASTSQAEGCTMKHLMMLALAMLAAGVGLGVPTPADVAEYPNGRRSGISETS